jgi:hypothetical protein
MLLRADCAAKLTAHKRDKNKKMKIKLLIDRIFEERLCL